MGLRSTLFGFVPGRRQAAGTLVASGVQRATLAGTIRGALADDLRAKLLYDLAYTAALEKFSTYIQAELKVLALTPIVLLRGSGQ